MKLDKSLQESIKREYSYIQNKAKREYKTRLAHIYNEHPELENKVNRLKYFYIQKAKAKVQKTDQNFDAEIFMLKKDIENYIQSQKIDMPEEYICSRCKDTGYDKYGNYCTCYNEIFRKVVYKDNVYNNLFDKCTFEKLDYLLYDNNRISDGIPSNREAVTYICDQSVRLAEDCKNMIKPKFQNFLILGNVGVGKTFISIAIANEFINRNIYVRFISAIELADILSSFDEEKYIEFEKLKEVPLLIIDDLGIEYPRSTYMSRLFELLNHRQINKLPMVITSNLRPKDIIDNYTERFWSKLQQDTRIYSITGEDLRHIK